jgi:hypothetical protein
MTSARSPTRTRTAVRTSQPAPSGHSNFRGRSNSFGDRGSACPAGDKLGRGGHAPGSVAGRCPTPRSSSADAVSVRRTLTSDPGLLQGQQTYPGLGQVAVLARQRRSAGAKAESRPAFDIQERPGFSCRQRGVPCSPAETSLARAEPVESACGVGSADLRLWTEPAR